MIRLERAADTLRRIAHIFQQPVLEFNPRATIAGRARQLRDVCDRKRIAFAQRFDGTVAQVLVETTRDPRSGELRGYTRNYLRVRLDGPDAWMGSMVPTRLRVSEGRVGAEALA